MTPVAIEERLVYFPCGSSKLAGILAVPAQPNGRAVLLPWGASPLPSSGRNRERTRVARALAEEGFHTFRFDYRGVGESDGDLRRADMAAPHTEEIIAACTWLTSQGLSRIVVVANCFGSWSSLMAAPKLPGLQGMALVNGPVWRDHGQVRATWSWRWWVTHLGRLRWSKLRSAERRARYRKLVAATASSFVRTKAPSGLALGSRDSRYSRAVRHLLDRGIPTFLMYGQDDFRADFESELDRGLRALLERAGATTRLVTVSEQLAVWSLGAQDLLLKELVPWLRDLPDSSPQAKESASPSWAGGAASQSTAHSSPDTREATKQAARQAPE
jgi:pimeloyl-ACP methyl ester carboxylesterase